MKMDMPLNRNLALAVMLAVLGVSQPALAHKLNLFAYAEGDMVSVEGYFADGKKAQNSAVKVVDSGGALLVEGVTDDEGMYRFKTPQQGSINIILNAGMGHQGEFLMSATELGNGIAPRSVSTPIVTGVVTGAETDQAAMDMAAAPATGGDVEAVVHRAVNEAIKPLVRELAESRQKASISDLVGAVGYIFGLMGLFAFYKARQIGGKEKPTEKG
jgi:nickel transport protein